MTRCCSWGRRSSSRRATSLYAMALGHEGDHMNNMVSLLWAYGGRIANEQGVPDMINPANKAGIDMAVQLWKAQADSAGHVRPDGHVMEQRDLPEEPRPDRRQPVHHHGLAAGQRHGARRQDRPVAAAEGLGWLLRRRRLDRLQLLQEGAAGGRSPVSARVLYAARQRGEASPSRSKDASSRSTATTPRPSSGPPASLPSSRRSPSSDAFANTRPHPWPGCRTSPIRATSCRT